MKKEEINAISAKAVERITAERNRQINSEGFDPEWDDQYTDGELAFVAAAYTIPNGRRDYVYWPQGWDDKWWKPSEDGSVEGRIRELEKAGALILAEMERLMRKSEG